MCVRFTACLRTQFVNTATTISDRSKFMLPADCPRGGPAEVSTAYSHSVVCAMISDGCAFAFAGCAHRCAALCAQPSRSFGPLTKAHVATLFVGDRRLTFDCTAFVRRTSRVAARCVLSARQSLLQTSSAAVAVFASFCRRGCSCSSVAVPVIKPFMYHTCV